jgi:hypothetical protein
VGFVRDISSNDAANRATRIVGRGRFRRPPEKLFEPRQRFGGSIGDSAVMHRRFGFDRTAMVTCRASLAHAQLLGDYL